MNAKKKTTSTNAIESDILVIGAGMSGLYSTWRLLMDYSGWKINIVEMLDRTGGRLDTDIFIRREDTDRVKEAMKELGFNQPNAPEGEHVSHQFIMEQQDAFKINHVYDFHWKIMNPVRFADLFTFEELWDSSVTLSKFASLPRSPAENHALMIACVHRVAHHYDSDYLPWLYDIYLLSKDKEESWFLEFERLARQKEVFDICRRGLFLTQQWFSDFNGARPRPPALRPGGGQTPIAPKPRLLDVIFDDFRMLPSWKERLRLLKEHAFPQPSYICRKYNVSNPLWLPFLYIRRLVFGIFRLIRRPQS